jgi:hypothetical protein
MFTTAMAEETRPVPGVPRPEPARAGNGTSLLKVRDPLGNTIILDVETWEKHITLRHPEMKEYLESLKVTLEQPILIQRAPVGGSTCFYYRLTGRNFHKYKDVFIGVVVELPEGSQLGRVKTAHLLRQLRKQEGEILWLRNS